MAEDEESIPIVQNPELDATSSSPGVEKDAVLPVAESVVGGADVAVDENRGSDKEQTELNPELSASSVVAIDAAVLPVVAADGGGDADEALAENRESVEELVEREVVAGTEETENEVVAEERITVLEKDKATEALDGKEEVSGGNVMALEKDEMTEALHGTENMDNEDVSGGNIVALEKDEKIEDEPVNSMKDDVGSKKNEKDDVGSRKNENVEGRKEGYICSAMSTGADDETEIVTRSDSTEDREYCETVKGPNASTVEASTSIVLGKDERAAEDETANAKKVAVTQNEEDGEKVVMTGNDNDNDETMADMIGVKAETEIEPRNDRMDDAENSKAVKETNVLSVEASTSIGSGKATKLEELEIARVMLNDSGGIKLEKENDAMDAEDEAANVAKVVVSRTEKDYEMVSQVNSSALGGIRELEEKDGGLVEGMELKTQGNMHNNMSIDADIETELVNGDDNMEDAENGETAAEANVLTVKACTSMGLGKDEKMEAAKTKEMEKEDEAMDAENETANTKKVAVTQNDEVDEVVPRVDDSTVNASIESEKGVEMGTVKQEKVDPVSVEEEDEGTGAEDEAAHGTTEIETETDMTESGKASGEKRKRKNTKSNGKSKSVGRASSRKAIGEDVCFICFDGGDLVLCDRRGCTKAYHPSCVDRDEEFFRAKGRWNCGWHQCTICEKNAYYMCYTCTFSLCKGCLKDDAILCVRGNKGFCKTCMSTVKLIEGLGQEEKDGPIDFDDRGSFEYLFKDYFMDLKSKLSLSSDEIANAKSPWKGADVSATKKEPAEAQFANNDGGSGSDASIETLEASKAKRRKIKKCSKVLKKEEGATTTAASISEGFSTARTTEWASKELLELVKHMKNGDTSVLSQFDVQALLLEYIKTNKLRDPRRKSQIICDARLERLFGKPRVGHFEMLKLLESHFLMKEDSQMDDVQGSVVDTEVSQLEADADADTPTRGVKDRKRKRKKGENRGRQSNLDEYAAIDVHNISLIFLRRKLVEDLLEENDRFQDKIAGTFVRIRISGNVQKQELYRLVQVVGTSKAVEPYKLGKRTTDIALEILNLNKTEVLSIDTISNQDFTEEECKRLRQSIKCGLINRLTVGDILDKATEIQTVRVNDWLESEIQRLSHLRDRASEKGRKKELRECVEKLQLLKTPDERHRRLEEVPEIHVDPKMDPSYESEDEDSENSRRDVHMRSRDSNFSRRGLVPVSPGSNFSPKDSWGAVGKISSKNWELNRNSSGKNVLSRSEDGGHSGGGLNEDTWSEGRHREIESKNVERPISSTNSDPIGRNSQVLSRAESFSGVSSAPSSATLQNKVAETSIKINEAEKMWHYKDPSGKIQGPFSMVQLRKWSNTGYFPADLKIWKATDKEEESILLTDALAGKFEKVPSVVDSILPTAVLQNRDGERPQVNKNVGSQNSLHLVSSGGGMASSVEVSALSTERWSNNDSSNFPSPTPKQGTAGCIGGDGLSVTVAKMYPGGSSVLPSPPALPDSGVRTSAFVDNSGGHSARGLENNYMNSGGDVGQLPTAEQVTAESGYSLQNAQSIVAGEQHTALINNQLRAQDTALQSESLNMQNPNALAPGQPQGYGNWATASSSVQNLGGNFANAGASALPQPDYWRAPAQGSQQNMQPASVPTVPWVTGLQENMSSASALRPENNSGWGMMPGNPNVGWGGPAPAIMNVNWGATVQAMPPGNANPGWVPTGTLPGSLNPGWVAQSVNPGVQGMAPVSANPGWVAPTASMGSTMQGPTSGNEWAMGTANAGAQIQGAPQGDSNQGGSAPTGNQGARNNDHRQDRRFSGQMDKGSHGSNSGYSNNRNWNRQSSSGNRGPGGSSRGNYFNRPCPYYPSGRCIKGSRCSYSHS